MSDSNGLIIKDNNEDLCSICLESVDYDLKIITHYKHYLHQKCLQIYVTKCKKKMPLICPVCNNEEYTIDEKYIFLNSYCINYYLGNNNYFFELKIFIYCLVIFGVLLYLDISLQKNHIILI